MAFIALRRTLLSLLVLAFAAFAVTGAGAQVVGQPAAGLVADQRSAIEALAKQTDQLERRIEANLENDSALVEIRLELEDLSGRVLATAVAFRPRLAEINARLEQLGAPPAEGQPAEPDIVATEREGLLSEKAEINAVLGVAESLSIRISALVERIGQIRRDLFANLLTKRYEIDLTLAGTVLDAFYSESASLYRTVSSWLRFVFQYKLKAVLAATFFAVAAAAVLMLGGRRLFGRLIVPDPDNEEPSTLSRLSVAFWSTLLPTAALAVFLSVTYFLYETYGVLRGDIGAMLSSLFSVTAIVFFVHRLGLAVLSPRLPSWRLIGVASSPARLLLWLVTTMAVVTGLDAFLSRVYDITGAPLALTVGKSLVASVLTGIPLILIARVKPYVDAEGRRRPWHALARVLLYALGGVTIGSALLGYLGFASFLTAQIVITGAVLATMYIGYLSARAVAEEGAFARTRPGRWLQDRFSLDESTLDQLSLLVSVGINLFVLTAGLPLILFLWGFQQGDLEAWLGRLVSGFRIGTFTFSPAGILSGILVFVIGFVLTRWFQNWLDGSVMARGRVDAGVRNSIRLTVGYAGIAVAGLIAISAAGIDLSNLALVAGALSLGIGFGLQNVVSNFVSGLILLAERPFKVGDWIVAGQTSGMVRKISVRATEIETFQRQTVILPNSDLINSAVGNWTHRNRVGRVDIKVGVAYDSDAVRAHAIMTEIARSHPLVMKNPEPFVLFANFGPTALEFEIRFFLADVLSGSGVQNDIRFAIMERFKAEGIAIPSAVRAPDPAPPGAASWPADDDRVEAEHAAAREAEDAQRKSRRRGRRPDPG